MFTNFDGAHRRTPNVSIRGASKKESKEELLERAHRERTKRETERLHLAKALDIQSFYRGYRARKLLKEELRSRFDAIRVGRKSDYGDEKIVLASSIKIFFDKLKDAERLTWLCQTCVKERQDIFQKLEIWLPFKISHLITLSLRYCSELATSKDNLGPALRFLEIFSNTSLFPPNIRINQCKTLIRKGYYRYLRQMCDNLIPPIYKETTVPPTPISEVIMELINAPLNLLSSEDKSITDVLRRIVISEVTAHFFYTPFSEQLELFVLPSVASNPNFPLEAWSDVLISQEGLVPTPWLFFACVSIGQQLTKIGRNSRAFVHYLSVLEKMSSTIIPHRYLSQSLVSSFNHSRESDESDLDENGESGDMDTSGSPPCLDQLKSVLKKSLLLLNSSSYTKTLASVVDTNNDTEAIQSLCRICHNLLVFDPRAIHQFKILSILAFRPTFLHNLWNLILSKRREDNFGGKFIPLMTVISRGMRLSRQEMADFVPLLAVFDSLFAYLLVTIHDIEFYGDEVEGEEPQKHRWMPFTLSELVPMSLALRDATLGLVELAYPETRPPMLSDEYKSSLAFETSSNYLSQSDEVSVWTHLFKATVELVRQLHTRDTRRRFCPDEHWTSERVALTVEKVPAAFFQVSAVQRYRLFQGLTRLARSQLAKDGPPQSAQTVRLITVLREMPYAVPFYQRIRVFQGMVSRDREEHQNDMEFFVRDKAIAIHCRRNFLYEDAYDKLSPENEPNLRLKMKVSLSNTVGLEEAGVDGGGLFREFLSELLKTAFDPNRGFFKINKDQQLYPNPSVGQIIENYIPHYFFIGRMLGKALYENMLIELPMASFFLSKLLGQHSSNVDIDHLQSLDPELYKNLLYLKTYDGNVQDLGLDFTVVTEELGQTIVEELKPNGSEIPVTNDNRIEYVHLVADYKLNRQIRTQCNAFRHGLDEVIKLEWLRMFSYRELQTLISGADHAINVDDLMTNTTYGHGFTESHETVSMFWNVVRSFTESQKRKLLKFVTSCSRPPLLGFKDLTPPFCIQNAGDVPDRLPTSSTCMNLLKLPEFKSEDVLRAKLLYAIEAGAGFELS